MAQVTREGSMPTVASMTYTILKAELCNGYKSARFYAKKGDDSQMLVMIRRKGYRWKWRELMPVARARKMYKKKLREGWGRVVLR